MDELNRLTVVIPSFGRHDYLLRQISFWSNSAARVVIIDGSPDQLALGTQLPSNIEYIHDPSPFAIRMLNSVGCVKTDFVAVLAFPVAGVKSAAASQVSRGAARSAAWAVRKARCNSALSGADSTARCTSSA